MKGWRIFFALAAAYNILGGAVNFFGWRAGFERMGIAPPNYPFFVQLLFLCVLILGIGYAMVAFNPLGNRNLVILGLLTKVAGIGMSYWAIASGQMPPSTWWQPLVNDLGWAIGFTWFLIWPPRAADVVALQQPAVSRAA